MKSPILIFGPTASGKTELAIELANLFDGEVVNADSMQVYQDLCVLTDRPPSRQQKSVPHHLFGHVDGSIRYSVGSWLKEVSPLISDIQARQKTPIIAGGTGLYFHALVNGINDFPQADEEVKTEVSLLIETEGLSGLYTRLLAVDPVAARRIEQNDRQRLARAYEVWLMTGVPFSGFKERKAEPMLSEANWLGIALYPDRKKLYARIEARFDSMLPIGAVEEVEKLSKRELHPYLPIMKAHGVPWICAYLRGEMDIQETCTLVKQDVRRYAKRQYTWIGRQFPEWPRIPSLDITERVSIVNSLYEVVDQKQIVG